MRTSVVLPAPLGPSSPNTVPGLDLEVEAVERDDVAERVPDAVGADGGHGGHDGEAAPLATERRMVMSP